jgi:hypothetical protein
MAASCRCHRVGAAGAIPTHPWMSPKPSSQLLDGLISNQNLPLRSSMWHFLLEWVSGSSCLASSRAEQAISNHRPRHNSYLFPALNIHQFHSCLRTRRLGPLTGPHWPSLTLWFQPQQASKALLMHRQPICVRSLHRQPFFYGPAFP